MKNNGYGCVKYITTVFGVKVSTYKVKFSEAV